jgi:hypothetical protein
MPGIYTADAFFAAVAAEMNAARNAAVRTVTGRVAYPRFEAQRLDRIFDYETMTITKEPIPEAAPPKVEVPERPALPEGVRYLFPDQDNWTITDLGDKTPTVADLGNTARFVVYYDPGNTYAYLEAMYMYPSDLRDRIGIFSPRYLNRKYHIVLQPAGASFNAHDCPLTTSFYSRAHPFAHKKWFTEAVRVTAEHAVDFSAKHPGMLMYFQSVEKRMRGIRTPIKPARYLKKYFGDILSETEIHDLGVEFANAAKPPVLSVTQDADEIEAVYRGKYNGSCMHFAHGGWSGSCHPARVYAGPDLGVAYIGDMDNADARVLVWPDKKKYYPKFYGDDRRMRFALEAAGYTGGDDSDFEGSRLQRIPDGEGRFVAPHLDFCTHVDDDGTWLITGGDDIECRNTNGLSDRGGYTCAYSGETYTDEDDMVFVDGYGSIGPDALEESFFRCSVSEEYYHNNRRLASPEEYPVSDYARRYFRDRIFYCASSEMYYPKTEFTSVEMHNGDLWEETEFDMHGGVCEFSGAELLPWLSDHVG